MSKECYSNGRLLLLTRIGIPLYFGEQNAELGGWMMDNALPGNETGHVLLPGSSNDHPTAHLEAPHQQHSGSLFLVLEKDNKKLFEFENKQQFKQQQILTTHELTHAFAGKLKISKFKFYNLKKRFKVTN